MDNFKLIESGLDVQPLLNKLEAMPELWDEIKIRQEYPGSAHHDTEAIFLRGPKTLTTQDYFFNLESRDYPAKNKLLEAIAPLMEQLNTKLQWKEFGRMMIVKLKPHGHVDAHIDEGDYADHFSRFHIALQTSRGAALNAEKESCHMRAGECWWFNHKARHGAFNFSDVPRIHLIFDAVSPLFKVGGEK